MIFTRRKFLVASAAVAATAITAFAAPITEPTHSDISVRASLITSIEKIETTPQTITADSKATVDFTRDAMTSKKKPEPKPVPKKETPPPKAPITAAAPIEQNAVASAAPVAEALSQPAAPVASGDTSIAASKEFARATLAAKGLGENEFVCLDNLWERESNWNFLADNPTSDAYGIPQSLPGEKMAAFGADWATNPQTQIKWGLSYIEERYATPCGAWAHSEMVGWY